jgi:hypothetical protein
MDNLKCLYSEAQSKLYRDIEGNNHYYKESGFDYLLTSKQNTMEIGLKADLAPLNELIMENTKESEVENSLLVWRALQGIPASLATENRFWTLLTHVNCYDYTKNRWPQTIGDNQEESIKQIKKHFFAVGTGGYRDDNAISRLWWNAYIANNLRPTNIRSALELILKKADIRSGLIERPLSFYRPNLSKAILDKMEVIDSITDKENNFREFMKQVNLFGGGVLFECMDSQQCSSFVDQCWESAQHNLV